ncbi:PQQ-binding-like beta-propeller repeat protein [Streptomyces sp. NPDC001634]|uniref:PQQ-binding-like beta-propeller repeat protein n=1 Tax=Streptomyces sp. NPDC001634 TaxID=3154390 RepID=UPI00332174F3
MHGGTPYVNNGRGGHVLALDPATGTQLWRTMLPTPFGALHTTPAIDGNTLYVGCRDGKLWALNATTGAVRWHVPTGGRVDSSPCVADGTVYFGSEDGHLWAIGADNGRVTNADTARLSSRSPRDQRSVSTITGKSRSPGPSQYPDHAGDQYSGSGGSVNQSVEWHCW